MRSSLATKAAATESVANSVEATPEPSNNVDMDAAPAAANPSLAPSALPATKGPAIANAPTTSNSDASSSNPREFLIYFYVYLFHLLTIH